VVENTYTQGTAWLAHRDAIEKYIKVLDALIKKHQPDGITSYELAWVLYGSDDSSSLGTVHSTSWTSDVGEFRQWADGIRFQGGGEKAVSVHCCRACSFHAFTRVLLLSACCQVNGPALAAALAEVIYLSKCPYPGGAEPVAKSGKMLV
jgi:hypothetical protein